MAFSQAIEMEGDVPARYIALAKAEENLGKPKKAVEALENAYELDPKVSTLRQILAIYEGMGDAEAAMAVTARIEEQIMRDNKAKQRKAASAARKMMPRRRVPARAVAKKSNAPAANPTNARVGAAKAPGKKIPRIIKSHVGRKRI